MSERMYSVGTNARSWRSGDSQTITFIVTDDCNLRCKYCYITHKSAEKRMRFETAQRFIDYILTSDIRFAEAVILDFIGGEPMLEAPLISQICDYFKVKAFELNHPWYWNYRINICTNGVNYGSKDVQALIRRNFGKISVSITLDGTKEKHDLQRVFPDGSGSYDAINQNIDLWLSQFRGTTKVTFASDDLPYLKDSIISLWNRGITEVSSNVVFEDVWKDGDDQILEEQLMQLADYILDNQLYNSGCTCTFFDDALGSPYKDEDLYKTFCGAGKMLALSADGDIYPCLRYYGHSLDHHASWPIGNLEYGIDMEKVRPFMAATVKVQSSQECLECPIAGSCPFCQGFNYDDAETPTNFHRATYNCKMHKARVRANDYYFAKLKNVYGIHRRAEPEIQKSLYILLSDDYVSYCCYENHGTSVKALQTEELLAALRYSREFFMQPVFVHSQSTPLFELPAECVGYDILHILPAEHAAEAEKRGFQNILPVFDRNNISMYSRHCAHCILTVPQSDIGQLAQTVKELFDKTDRINLYITGLTRSFDEQLYRHQLLDIKDWLVQQLTHTGLLKELDVLTDLCFEDKHDNCRAGEHHITVGPDGKLYACPAFYSTQPGQAIGDLAAGITRKYSARLYSIKNHPICEMCDAFQCRDCVYTNWTNTNEVNVSPSFQCRKAHIEREVSQTLLPVLQANPAFCESLKDKNIPALGFLDPITQLLDKAGSRTGVYQYKAN